MAARDLAIGMIFLVQTIVGLLGNSSLLSYYLFLCLTGCRSRSIDSILKHLTVGNSLVILAKGVPQTRAALGLRHSLSDLGCKLLLYVHRVGRGVSISTTCLLSVLQAVIISPWTSRWAQLKWNALKYVSTSIFLCWILQILVNVIFPIYITGKLSNKNITNNKDFRYCSAVRHNRATDSVFAALLSFPDVVCLGLMLGASSCMVLILHRHKLRVQHIRTTNASHQCSESRATKTILLLVSTFVGFYMLSTIFQVMLSVVDNPSWFLLSTNSMITLCFPTVSPYVLMCRDSRASRLCFA
nr:vomeronasal type-1 receptor 4-like [Manis javanica]